MNEEEFDDIAKTLQIELNAVRYAAVKEMRIFNCDVAAFREMLGEYIDNLGYGLGQFTRHAEVKKNYDSTLLIVEAIKTRTALLKEGTGFSILTPAVYRKLEAYQTGSRVVLCNLRDIWPFFPHASTVHLS